MANEITTTANGQVVPVKYYNKLFLETAMQWMRYAIGAKKETHPLNSGKTHVFSRVELLDATPVNLDEILPGTNTALTTTTVEASVGEYGRHQVISSMFDITSLSTTMEEVVKNLGVNAGMTVDNIIKTELGTGVTSEIDVSATGGGLITGASVRKARRDLAKNGAPVFPTGMYKSVIPVDVSYDLMGDTEWINAKNYAQPKDLLDGNIGRLSGVEFFETNNPHKTGTGVNATYKTFVFGMDAYALIDLATKGFQNVIVKKDGSDPYDRTKQASWRVITTAKVLNTNFIVSIKSKATV